MSKCVGCGYCCMEATCTAGLAANSDRTYTTSRCPSLQWNGKRYVCELMMDTKYGEMYREKLYAGAGCCSGLNSWRKDVKKRD